MILIMHLGSISDQKTHNYLSGTQALHLEDGSDSDEMDVLDQLAQPLDSRQRTFPGLHKLREG